MPYPTAPQLAALALCCTSLVALRPPRQDTGPQMHPTLFGQGLISTGLSERDGSRSADGSCFAYTLQGARGTAIALVEWNDGRLGQPELAPFSGTFADIEPAFDPRGDRLWFASQRPLPGGNPSAAGDWNLWVVDYRLDGSERTVAEPSPLTELNSAGHEFYPSVARTGELVFTAERQGGAGGEDLWLATPGDAGEHGEHGDGWSIINAGPVNTPGPEFNACLRPDGGALVFSSVRAGDQGGGDLYLSLRQADGRFGPARALTSLNSPALDYCPSFSADGRILWFTSQRVTARSAEGEAPPRWSSFSELSGALGSAGNGSGDIYWVLASALE